MIRSRYCVCGIFDVGSRHIIEGALQHAQTVDKILSWGMHHACSQGDQEASRTRIWEVGRTVAQPMGRVPTNRGAFRKTSSQILVEISYVRMYLAVDHWTVACSRVKGV